jgi:hypothetical protein
MELVLMEPLPPHPRILLSQPALEDMVISRYYLSEHTPKENARLTITSREHRATARLQCGVGTLSA